MGNRMLEENSFRLFRLDNLKDGAAAENTQCPASTLYLAQLEGCASPPRAVLTLLCAPRRRLECSREVHAGWLLENTQVEGWRGGQ